MNISYNWLKDLVETNLPPSDLAKKLTDAGLAVEGIHEAGDDFIFDIAAAVAGVDPSPAPG